MRILLATLALAAAVTADAKPMYVDFTLKQLGPYGDGGGDRRAMGHDRHSPRIYAGTWSFDDSLVKPGGLFEDVHQGRRLDQFSFSWAGERWHPGNVRLARLEFDADGELRSWIIGGTAVSGDCGNVGTLDCVGVPSSAADFYVVGTRSEPGVPGPEVTAVGVHRGGSEFIEAQGSFRVRETTSVPTAGTLPLLSSALLLLAAFGRIRNAPERASSPQSS